ncbi:MAG: M81 family peptidase [Comamonadaceae bacterium]|nr:MAG: M81 family peptidase [Comamonadaceae bacterium]
MNIFIAGFQHETNTFAPTRADWAAFEAGAGFPAYRRGDAVVQAYRGRALPIGGFIVEAEARGWTLSPSGWAGANPSAHVTREAFERIAGDIDEDLRAALAGPGVHAVYLDLHGAAVAEHLDDPEGELVARIRARVGADVPVVASLDLHANVTARMLALADGLVAYRTYPHVDMHDTGVLAARLLARRLARGSRQPMAVRRLDFLLPLNAQCTMAAPAGAIYQALKSLDAQHGTMLSFAMGFPAADIAECGPVIWAYGEDAEQAEAAVAALFARVDQPRGQWQLDILAPDEAVREAMARAADADRPVVIADTQDNPGAGGDGNTTGLLHALLACGAGARFPGQVALGLLADPGAAAAAHAAGEGAQIDVQLGRSVPTWGGRFSDPPVAVRATVRRLSDGQVLLKGPMGAGSQVRLGLCACLEVDGVLVGISSHKTQMLDRELFRFLGIEPERMKILVNKSSVHFRADFAPIASHILVAKAAGPMAAEPADLPWTKLPASMALHP